MKTTRLLCLVLLCTFSVSLSAQWVKQTLPATIGTPHMTYPGLNKNAFGKNYFLMATFNFDGNNTQVGSSQAVRTTDGGRTYRTSTLPVVLKDHYYTTQLVDAKTAFLASTDYGTGATAIHRTVDSGATWQTLSYHPTSFLDAVIFFDQNNGIAICDPDSIGAFFAYSTNGGTSFTRLPQTNVPRPRPHEIMLGALHQVIGDVILQPSFDLETGEWRMWRSTDRGRNWTAGEWQDETSLFGPNLIFTDANNGFWIQGELTPNIHTFYTTDGGQKWQPSGALPGINTGGPMSYLPNTNSIVATFEDHARLMIFSAITNDYGKTWNSKKDIIAYRPDTIYNFLDVPAFAWTNLDIVDNTTAWAKLSRTELYKYTSTTPIVPEKPDLDLTLTADTEGLPLWGYVKFTLTITNRGISKATGIRTQWLPPYKRVPNGPEPFANVGGGAYSSKGVYNSWTGLWSIDELGAGESATVNVHLFVLQNTVNVSQSAQVTACNESDLDSSPNNMTATSTEDDEARFTSVKKASVAPEPIDVNLPRASATTRVFPNPTTNKVNIAYQLAKIDDLTFTLTDANGRVVLQKEVPSVKTGVETFEVGDLAKGVYMLKMVGTSGEIRVQKIVKE